MHSYIRVVAVVTIFSLVAFLGAFVKLGGAASIALDSWASFFVAAFFGPLYGGAVASLGHLLSALTGGFPFTPPVHALVAVLQFAWAAIFGIVARRSNTVAGIAIAAALAIALNGVAAPLVIGVAFPHLMPAMQSLIPVLALASLVNVVIAASVLLMMRRVRRAD